MLAFVDQIFVSLVCEDDDVALLREARDLLGLLAREDDAVRVLRRVEVDGARALCRVASKRLDEASFACLGGGDENGRALAVRDEVFDGSPVGREDQNLVAWVDDRLERAEESLHAAVKNYHVRLARVDSVTLAKLRGDDRAQFGYAGRGRVARLVVAEGARHRLLDLVGRVEERLAALELIEDRKSTRLNSSHTVISYAV